MNSALLLFFLSVCVAVLIGIVIYQQFAFGSGTQRKLKEISQKLEEILDRDSGENVMVFTDNHVLMDLAAQINRMLENRRKIRVDYRRYFCSVVGMARGGAGFAVTGKEGINGADAGRRRKWDYSKRKIKR